MLIFLGRLARGCKTKNDQKVNVEIFKQNTERIINPETNEFALI